MTLGFNTPILNDPADHAYGLDFTIFGNEFFVNGSGGTISGVFNHPGLTVWVSMDDINFYQLAPPPGGAIQGADDSISDAGQRDATLPVNPAFTLSTFVGQTPAQAISLYAGSAGGASYSISWAEDGNGQPVALPSISYIKIEGSSSGIGYVDAVARVQSVPEPPDSALVLLCAGGFVATARFRARQRYEAGPDQVAAGTPFAVLLEHWGQCLDALHHLPQKRCRIAGRR